MHFESFDSIEDAMEKMRQQEEAANKLVLPCQREVKWGSCWARPWTDGADTYLIFGQVYTEKELYDSERQHGASAIEAMETTARMNSTYERGYRFGRAYSIIVPEGELGETHISQMFGVLTPEQFSIAQLFDWQPEHIAREPWFKALVARAYSEARQLGAEQQ